MLRINEPEVERLARDLAKRWGKPASTIVKEALQAYALKMGLVRSGSTPTS